MSKWGPILLPLVTPFDANEEVICDAYARPIGYPIKKNDRDPWIVMGAAGTVNDPTVDARIGFLEIAVKPDKGRKPIIAATGGALGRETITPIAAVGKIGAGMRMSVGPYSCKPNPDGVEHLPSC